MYTLAIALALTLTADPKAKDNKSNDTMKGLLKDAVNTGGATAADGGAPVHNDADGPDTTKMAFSQDSIRKVVAFHQPKIQSCYEETLAGKDKAIEGVLKTAWIITPNGMVKSAKIEKKGTTLKEPKLHDCVVAVLSSMQFPVPPDGKQVPIDYPFNLKAVH